PVFAGSAVSAVADVSRAQDCARAVDQATGAFGRLDILINCAGVSMGPASQFKHGRIKFFEADPDGWQRVVTINALGAFLMARFAAPSMVANNWGRIINVTTSYDTMLAEGLSAYGASKAALEAATVSWSKDLAATGVTVNVLVPGGPVDTPGFFPPGAERPPRMLQPDVMAVPVVWLAPPKFDRAAGPRFHSRGLGPGPPARAAAPKSPAPAAWVDRASAAQRARGAPI